MKDSDRDALEGEIIREDESPTRRMVQMAKKATLGFNVERFFQGTRQRRFNWAGEAAKVAKAVITLATCASREVCRPDVWRSVYSYSSPSFPSPSYIIFLIHICCSLGS